MNAVSDELRRLVRCLATGVSVSLAACSTAVVDPQRLTPAAAVAGPVAFAASARVGEIAIVDTSTDLAQRLAPQAVRTALEQALQRTSRLQVVSGPDADLTIDVSVLDWRTVGGVAMRSLLTVCYVTVAAAPQGPPRRTDCYTSEAGSRALAGGTRITESLEASMRENIAAFLAGLDAATPATGSPR